MSVVRAYTEWKKQRREKYVVKIDHPRMDIKGMKVLNMNNDAPCKKYIAFAGIPYAQRPDKSRRFQPPEELTDRDVLGYGLFKAYEPEHKCAQRVRGRTLGNEDCLYLNIYLPRKPRSIVSKLPVLVYIHGGCFTRGSASISEVNPVFMVQKNLALVTVNYRLGVFGFLNMGTDKCRGNAGLKDQVMALKWIQKNIDRFGGDPTNVTIQGHGAGATCVNLHMISPMSRGYFHRAIVSSGGITCPWGFLGNESKVITLFRRACKGDSPPAVVNLLKKKDGIGLLNFATQQVNDDVLRLQTKDMSIFFGPTEEAFEEGAFIPYDVARLKREATPVPLMAGICAAEGYTYILEKNPKELNVKRFRDLIDEDDKFESFLMDNFHWSKESARRQMATIRDMYFKDRNDLSDSDVEHKLALLMTDIWFRCFYDNFEIGVKQKAYFVYNFFYVAPENKERQALKSTKKIILKAASYYDDFNYIYDPIDFQERDIGQFTSGTRRIINHLCQMIGDFCKAGDFESSIFVGDTEWKPHTEENPCFLYIILPNDLRLVKCYMYQSRWRDLNALVAAENDPSSSLRIPRPHELRLMKSPNKRFEEVPPPEFRIGPSMLINEFFDSDPIEIRTL